MVEYIGLDIGGTNIRIGAINEKEEIVFNYKELNNINNIFSRIKELIKMVPNYKKAKAIGIALPGSVDSKTNKVVTSKNIPSLIGYPLKEELEKEFNKTVFIENDAKVATLAESIKGKGIGKEIVCYITISTGCGGGIVINKKIYHGSNNLGGYIPRIILDGKNTCDDLLSSRALLIQAKERINNNIKDTKELFDLYEKRNNEAKKIIEDFKHNLVVLLLNISAIINPDIFIIGGGVTKSSKVFLNDVRKEYYNIIHPLGKNTIIDIESDDDIGIIGACLLPKYN